MDYPSVLKAGTIIRIGDIQEPSFNPTAIGLEFKLVSDVPIHFSKRYLGTTRLAAKGIITKNPNKWHSEEVYHCIDLTKDTILGMDYANNKEYKFLLDRCD